MSKFRFSAWYLLILLLIVLVISVFIGYTSSSQKDVEGYQSPTTPILTQTTINGIHYSVYELYKDSVGNITYFDVSGLGILYSHVSGQENSYYIQSNGDISGNVNTTNTTITPVLADSSNISSNVSIKTWSTSPKTSPNIYVWYNNVNNKYVCIYVQDRSDPAGENGIPTNLYFYDTVSKKIHTNYVNCVGFTHGLWNMTTLASSNITSSNVLNYASVKDLPENSSGMGLTNDGVAYIIVTKTPDNPIISVINANLFKFNSVYYTGTSNAQPTPNMLSSQPSPNTPGSQPSPNAPGSNFGNNMSGNTGAYTTIQNPPSGSSLDALLLSMAGAIQKIGSNNNNNQGLGSFSNDWLLKSQVVPPVCPQCPCGGSNCALSINANGQVVDCNGNPVNNFGTGSGSGSGSGYAPASGSGPSSSTYGGNVAGVLNNTVSTAGNVAGSAIGDATGAASSIAGTAGSTLSNLGSSAGTAASNVASSAEKGLSNVTSTAGTTASGLGQDVANVIGGLGKDATSLGKSAIGVVNNAVDKVGGSATSLTPQVSPASSAMQTPSATAVVQSPYAGYGYPYGGYPYGGYPYAGYGGYPYAGYQYPTASCSQQPDYMPLLNDFSSFGK